MTKFKRVMLGAILALAATVTHAHGNHADPEPITKDIASARGDLVMDSLVVNKKLAPSWQKKEGKSVTNHPTEAGLLWSISYSNPAEKDKAKQTIYIFLDEVGNYLGANHTGKF